MTIDAETRRFVETARVAHLATASADGDPHVVAVTFVLIDDDVFIAIDEKPKTTTRLKRIRNIEENPQATLLVDVYDDDWSKLGWAMLRGTASIIEGPSPAGACSRDEILAELRAKYPQYHSHDLVDRPIIRLAIERVTSWGRLGD